MLIDPEELSNRVTGARVAWNNGEGVSQAILARTISDDDIELSQSFLSAIERKSYSADSLSGTYFERVRFLTGKLGIEIPYLTNGVGSEVQENLANSKTQEAEAPRKVIPHQAMITAVRPLNREINVLACCAHEIETLADRAARGRVVDYLFQLYVQPFLKEHKE